MVTMKNLKIGIIGCGWLGRKMADQWKAEHQIYTTTTTEDKFERLKSDGLNPTLADFGADFQSAPWAASLDVVIITVPLSTRRDKDPDLLRKKVENLSKFMGPFKNQLFFTSTTSVYPNEEKKFDEEAVGIDQNLPECLLNNHFPQINILRLGGLMSDDRQLSKYKVSNLDDPVNHVHAEDIVSVVEKMIKNRSTGKLYNLVAPKHPTKRQVIAMQTNPELILPERPDHQKEGGGRLISSEKLIRELDYEFVHPDPMYFHLH